MLKSTCTSLTIALVAIVAESSGLIDSGSREDATSEALTVTARDRYEIQKLLNFSFYKQLFHKSYTSLSEELVRQKLFWARAFRAFISAISYKSRRTSHYLALNQMSDWTSDELAAIKNQHVARQVAPTLKLSESKLGSDEMKQRDTESALICLGPRKFSPEKIIDRPVPGPKLSDSGDVMEPLKNTGKVSLKIPLTDYRLALEWPKKSDQYTDTTIAREIAERITDPNGKVSCAPKEKDEVYVDHSKSGCLNEVQDQGLCGACYVFATMAYFEWSICKKTNELYKFSEQFIIDCGPVTEYGKSGHLLACIGGSSPHVAKYMIKYGIELEKDYTYQTKNGTCPYADVQNNHKLMGKFKLTRQAAKIYSFHVSRFKEYLPFTPILVDIDTRTGFDEYGGGVHMPTNCCQGFKTAECAQHTVLIVGYGREDGEEYWLIRNSYSVSWGEKGHYKLSTKSVNCLDPHYGRIFGSSSGIKPKHELKKNEKRPEWIQDRISNFMRYRTQPPRTAYESSS